MKKITIFLFFIATSISFLTAQQIEIKKEWGENRFYKAGNRLFIKDVIHLMEDSPEALAIMKQVNRTNTVNKVISFAGGALIGWDLGTLMTGSKPTWIPMGIGAVLTGISIKILSNTNKKSKQAVEIYNSSLIKDTSYQFQPEFKLIANERGVGLCVKF
ncbi:hypothetical protein [Capnocytophaga felis]|uniref:Uncharacterized protein n=1 Tax=Capnocytophaga felis TaxID=2267611 RepID=A0A5M4B968_9FLAO|nr:hypothetical protein [Capnocytophaga felis]GET45656.1 hypothetical protein RCZ01_09580 [Capnocytophaga felis]GET47181.1 hypothetical protein RCZ02_00120 [Capnocytophaga felis]